MRKLFMGLLAASCASSAFAGPSSWKISEASGQVSVSHAGVSQIAARNTVVNAGDTVATGRNGRAVLVRGSEFVMVAPGSQLRIPAEDVETSGMTKLLQDVGSVVFMIKKKLTPHFEVKTPYLAAVVKGTTFTVNVSPAGASVQVLEGAVDVATSDGGARELVLPGNVAAVGARDLFQLQIDGPGGHRVIESPSKSLENGNSSPVPPASQASPAGAPAARLETIQPMMIGTTIHSEAVSLESTTRGLVTGTVGGLSPADASVVSVVARETAEVASSVSRTNQVALASPSEIAQGQSRAVAAPATVDQAATGVAETKAANEMAKAAQDTEKAAAKAAQDAAKAQEQAARDAQKAADDAAKDAAKAQEQAARDAQKAADDAAKDAAKAQEQAARDAQKAADDAAKDAAKAQEQAAKDAQKLADQAAKAAQEAEKAAKDKAQQAAQAAEDLEKALKGNDEAAAQAAKAADEATKTQAEAEKVAAKAVADAAKEAQNAAAKAAQDAAKAAQDAAKAAEEAAKAQEEAQQAASKAAADAAKEADKAAAKAANDAAKAAQDAAKDAEKAAKELEGRVKGKPWESIPS